MSVSARKVSRISSSCSDLFCLNDDAICWMDREERVSTRQKCNVVFTRLASEEEKEFEEVEGHVGKLENGVASARLEL